MARAFWRWLQLKLRKERLVELDDVLLDATTIEVVLFARVSDSVKARFPHCWFGKKVVEKRWFFGRKLHLLSTPKGTMVSHRMTSGNMHDKRKFHSLVDERHTTVTADGGYRGIQRARGKQLNLTKPFCKGKNQRKLNGKRVGVERVFNVLKKLNLEKGVIVKTPQSLDSHVMSVLTCLLGIQYLNLKRGLNPLRYARFLC